VKSVCLERKRSTKRASGFMCSLPKTSRTRTTTRTRAIGGRLRRDRPFPRSKEKGSFESIPLSYLSPKRLSPKRRVSPKRRAESPICLLPPPRDSLPFFSANRGQNRKMGEMMASHWIDIPTSDGGRFKGYLAIPAAGAGPGILISCKLAYSTPRISRLPTLRPLKNSSTKRCLRTG
jgi:hypothetical protein